MQSFNDEVACGLASHGVSRGGSLSLHQGGLRGTRGKQPGAQVAQPEPPAPTAWAGGRAAMSGEGRGGLLLLQAAEHCHLYPDAEEP